MAKSSERFESLRRDIDALARRLDVPSVLIMRSLPRHMRVEASAGRLEDTYPIGAEGRKSVHEDGAKPLYCERVVDRDAPLHVRDSRQETEWAGDNLVATLDGTGSKRFLLMIHYDTVFAAGSAAKRPFREDAERAYGPGVADAKGGVAMVLHALALLRQQGFRDYGRITVLFNPDEETGSAGSKQLIAELARQQDYVFSYEPPDRDAVTVATNGIDGLLLEVKGRSSHAGSAPEQGRNAILELSHQLLRLKDLGDPAKGTTLNWTLARGGEKRNIIPAEASAEADMRYSDPAESERVLADARKLTGERLVADTEVSLRLDKGRPPLVKNPASQRLAETAQTLYGRIGKRIEPIAMRFGTDAGYAYVPGSDKPAVLETLGVVGAGLHSEAEYLELSSIAPRLYLTVALIRELSAD